MSEFLLDFGEMNQSFRQIDEGDDEECCDAEAEQAQRDRMRDCEELFCFLRGEGKANEPENYCEK
jgi:hypothetical protein